MKRFLIFLITTCALSAAAQTAPENTLLSREIRQCVFEKPLEVGASVTGQFGAVVPFYESLVKLFLGGGDRVPYSGSPSRAFISHYRNMGLLFAGPKYKVGSGVPDNQAMIVTNHISETGSGQIARMLDGDLRTNFARASLILGVDLFYWDAMIDLCGYGSAQYDFELLGREDETERRVDTEYQITRLIEAAQESGKILFLGTVPQEDAAKVKINYPHMWHPQVRACVDAINRTLIERCTLDKGCYLLDMRPLADRLNRGEKVDMPSLNQSFSLYDMRPDGVHLSRAASLFVAEEMIRMFEANPPHPASCRQLSIRK